MKWIVPLGHIYIIPHKSEFVNRFLKNNFGILISISITNLKLDFGFPFWKLNFEFRDGLDFQFQFSARAHR